MRLTGKEVFNRAKHMRKNPFTQSREADWFTLPQNVSLMCWGSGSEYLSPARKLVWGQNGSGPIHTRGTTDPDRATRLVAKVWDSGFGQSPLISTQVWPFFVFGVSWSQSCDWTGAGPNRISCTRLSVDVGFRWGKILCTDKTWSRHFASVARVVLCGQHLLILSSLKWDRWQEPSRKIAPNLFCDSGRKHSGSSDQLWWLDHPRSTSCESPEKRFWPFRFLGLHFAQISKHGHETETFILYQTVPLWRRKHKYKNLTIKTLECQGKDKLKRMGQTPEILGNCEWVFVPKSLFTISCPASLGQGSTKVQCHTLSLFAQQGLLPRAGKLLKVNSCTPVRLGQHKNWSFLAAYQSELECPQEAKAWKVWSSHERGRLDNKCLLSLCITHQKIVNFSPNSVYIQDSTEIHERKCFSHNHKQQLKGSFVSCAPPISRKLLSFSFREVQWKKKRIKVRALIPMPPATRKRKYPLFGPQVKQNANVWVLPAQRMELNGPLRCWSWILVLRVLREFSTPGEQLDQKAKRNFIGDKRRSFQAGLRFYSFTIKPQLATVSLCLG